MIIVSVKFDNSAKTYLFDSNNVELAEGDRCIVETNKGQEFGLVIAPPRVIPDRCKFRVPLRRVIRMASDEDTEIYEKKRERENIAKEYCLERIRALKLEMKLVNVEYTFEEKKAIFYFTAEGRVDFRELVKDLSSRFHTRIEMKQIGVRDEARMLGGCGPCGRSLCCATFLERFEPVSIKMAKKQNLNINPAKISGICGRLMCCLRYEYLEGSSSRGKRD